MNQPKFNIGDKVFVKKECIERHLDITNREYEIHTCHMQTSSPYCIIDDNGDYHFFMEDELFVGIKTNENIVVNMIEERIEQLHKSIKFSDSEIRMLTEQINSHVKKNMERNADIVRLNQSAEILSKNS